ncbi:Pho80p cyclin [Clarireedia jacksonii]
MLKSPSLNRSQASPTLFNHYAPAPSRPSLSRRTSTATKPSSSPQLQTQSQQTQQTQTERWAGVDKATQWSPIMPSSTGTAAPSAPVQVKAEEPPVRPPLTPSEIKTEPSDDTKLAIKDGLSPGTKRRQSATSATAPTERTSAPKRPKAARKPVKVLPIRYELCAVEDLVILIASMISELIETNDGLPLRTGVLTRFHSRSPPGISVSDYLHRLAKHATLTPPILLSMVYYCDRLCALYPAFTVTTLTVHRFLITAATVASKGLSDSFWNNATYARVGGVKLAELGLLELDFLYRVDWRIVPNPEVLVDYYKGLIDRNDDYVLEGTIKSEDEDSEDEDDDEVSDESDTIVDQAVSIKSEKN